MRRCRYLTPAEASTLAGVRPEQIERDVRLRRKSIARNVRVNDATGEVFVVSYFTADILREYEVRNAPLKLAALELARLLNRGSRALRARIEP